MVGKVDYRTGAAGGLDVDGAGKDLEDQELLGGGGN
jgi:hypothetical protein